MVYHRIYCCYPIRRRDKFTSALEFEIIFHSILVHMAGYHNDPKFLDRYAWANSADPDQTAPRGTV